MQLNLIVLLLNWVEFIKCMRSAGLPIEVLIEYVGLFRQGDETSEARKELLIEQRKQLITRMEDMKKTLERSSISLLPPPTAVSSPWKGHLTAFADLRYV